MQTFKKIILAAGLVLGYTISMAQTTRPSALAGPKGIWVICGDALPKNFSYQISRQKNNGEWLTVAEVKMPRSKDEIQADLINTERAAGIDIAPLDAARLQLIWDRITPDIITSSPPELYEELALRAATGTAWYDATADSATVYRYKVKMITSGTAIPEAETNIVKYPQEKFVTDIRPAGFDPSRQGFHGEFVIVDKGTMVRCKILRSYYLRSGYEELASVPLFVQRSGKTYISFYDNTAVAKVPYTYAILPIDAAGNRGIASPLLKAFDVPDKSIEPSVHDFRTHSDEVKKGIRLSWKVNDAKVINAIEIYRSDSYNGKYFKLATVRPADTSYLDQQLKPIDEYFYTIKLVGFYETSPLSPRVPGVLRASNRNLFPPQNLRIKQDSNKVTLMWQKNEGDTRAYYIYRAPSNGELKQIGAPIITDSVNVSFTDKLPASNGKMVYTYAVADENTSYAISPKSARVYAYSAGNTTLPIPYDLKVQKTNGNKLLVTWADMNKEKQPFGGYMLYRRVNTVDGKITEAVPVTVKIISAGINFYLDSLISDGATYSYSVRTVGFDGKKLGSPSNQASFTIPAEIPLSVANIKVFPMQKAVKLSWNNPMGQNIKSIQIYRALEGKAAQPIATLDAGMQTYTDKDVASGSTYFYIFTVSNTKGRTSIKTDAVGIHLD
ncbi:fibronectin type III domain-containing protein [Mucilaginibacter xinganensis]|uniref:Fibronectin type-III domain-containing protein n=1 Tax=Mucilaginibacter xinganensis TaxID=1234841 RepID=A0A223NRM8_9SPHI|nr:hypothetical protein [Mucilaginibacter xinganensis]ASU32559.1 hypothetical protein MuYL_0656 [Mucilaginibacter xinganensis]